MWLPRLSGWGKHQHGGLKVNPKAVLPEKTQLEFTVQRHKNLVALVAGKRLFVPKCLQVMVGSQQLNGRSQLPNCALLPV